MINRFKPPGTAALSLLTLIAGAGLAHSGEPLTVYTDHSRILTVARAPGTIIIGNPSIADVTIQGNQLYLHARAYGETNVVVMDEAGKLLADYDVTVQTGGANNVYVFKAGPWQTTTMVCAPECEATLHIGDADKPYFKVIAGQQRTRSGIAQGQKEGENVAPAAQAPSPDQ